MVQVQRVAVYWHGCAVHTLGLRNDAVEQSKQKRCVCKASWVHDQVTCAWVRVDHPMQSFVGAITCKAWPHTSLKTSMPCSSKQLFASISPVM